MGKKTDRSYITRSEWARDFGGAAANAKQNDQPGGSYRALPFDYCAISLQPWHHPVAGPDGIIYDIENIVPYLKQHGTSPATGEKMAVSQLIALHFTKNAQQEYVCPVTQKPFTNHTHIVCITVTGNVYNYEAVAEFNLKLKNLKDLLTDQPFKKSEILSLQDPNHIEKRSLDKFDYLKKSLKLESAGEDSAIANIRASGMTERILQDHAKQQQTAKEAAAAATAASFVDDASGATEGGASRGKAYNAAHYSLNRAAASFTSTSMAPVTQNEAALQDENEYMYERIKQSAYVKMHTNLGTLNIELYANEVPMTCHNFLLLCEREYYNGLAFHRHIPGFMIQGGDPTGTGRGGKSAFGKGEPFKDEFHRQLKHHAAGILSMANSGANTNGSQFFITFKAVPHLDQKHTVFGKVVGGLDVLSLIERTPAGKNDVPEREIKIERMEILSNPYADFQLQLKMKLAKQKAKEEAEAARVADVRRKAMEAAKKKALPDTVGKYMKRPAPTDQKESGPSTSSLLSSAGSEAKNSSSDPAEKDVVLQNNAPKSKKMKTGGFDNFDAF